MKYLDGKEFKNFIEYGYLNLCINKEIIDNLNVFPVPDGDTGTNMLLTYTSGFEAVKNLEGSIAEISRAFSKGLLMGARGNSGVITSQIFRGMSMAFEGMEQVDCETFIEGLISASETAYKGVMSPVEGTILTVIRESAFAMKKYRKVDDFVTLIDHLVTKAKQVLDNTPNLLQVLKEAGVVDSGGYGLVVIFEGFQKYLSGEELSAVDVTLPVESVKVSGESEFGYCTEFIIELDTTRELAAKFNEDMLKQQLTKLGDSLVVVHDDNIVKVHVHTLTPGEALNIGQKYGEFLKLKIENMTVQHEEILRDKAEIKEYAIISVSNGAGISELFYEYGVTSIIEGGQTMNPSTSDFVEKIDGLNAKNIIILPNNSNIIMAAEQACELVNDKNVSVVKTKSVMQAFVALTFFDESVDLETNIAEMMTAYEDLKVGEITYAVRDTVTNGTTIEKDDFIAITNKEVINASKTSFEALKKLLENMLDVDTELLMLIFGKDVSDEEKKEVEAYLAKNYPDVEIEFHDGKQEIYYYYVSCE